MHQPKVEFVYKFQNYNESNTSQHNYHDRRSSRSNKLFHTNYNLNVVYLTVFITQSYILPYKQWMNEKDFIIFVPYFKSEKVVKNSIFQTVKYGVILQTQLYKLHNIHKNMYNSKLQLIEKGNFELVQLIDDCAVRFCILPDIDFDRYYNEKNSCIYNLDAKLMKFHCKKVYCTPYALLEKLEVGNNKMMYADLNLTNISLPGTVVSMWKNSHKRAPISLKTCRIIEDSLQRGFGDRLSVPCLGVNCYFGNHHSLRLKNRPETITGERVNDYYARQNSRCKENIPLIERFIEYQTRLTKQEISTMNDHYMRFFGYNTCNRLI